MFNDLNVNNWKSIDKKNEQEIKMFFEKLIKSPGNHNELRMEIKQF